MGEMVSVIIPTYNRAREIGRAICSVLRQTYQSYEIVIVDDGSTDHTREVIWQIKDKRVRYIRYEQNQGAAHARNVGIQESRYDYIAFLDSDDEWMPTKLELQMHRMSDASEEVGLVYCRMSGETRGGGARYICPPDGISLEVLKGSMFPQILYKNVIGTPCVLVRKKCLEQTGGFKEALRCLEDWEWILRIVKTWKVEFVDEILVEVYRLEGSVSTNVGAYLVARCYMVSLYRSEMAEAGMLDDITEEILTTAEEYGLLEEIKELLSRNIEI